MSTCPMCGAEFIEGTDDCEQCGNSLTDTFSPRETISEAEGLLIHRIRELKPAKPFCVSPDTPTGKVLRTISEQRIGCALVTDQQQHLLGIFSERDALMRLSVDYRDALDKPISDFMTPEPHTLRAKDRIVFAVQRMDLGGYRHVPIVDNDGKAVGIVSVRDILSYMTENLSDDTE